MSSTSDSTDTPKNPPHSDSPPERDDVARQVDERIEMLQISALERTASSDDFIDMMLLFAMQRGNCLQEDYLALRGTIPPGEARVELAQAVSEIFYKNDKSVSSFAELRLRIGQAQARSQLISQKAKRRKLSRALHKPKAK